MVPSQLNSRLGFINPGLTLLNHHQLSWFINAMNYRYLYTSLKVVYEGYILFGGWATPLKNMKVCWDDDIPNMMGK